MSIPTNSLRSEIAACAAGLIAESGYDYGTAKRKAVEQLLGRGQAGSSLARNEMPDNEEVEDALREHLQLFMADTQPQRLQDLRSKASALMELLAPFNPYIVGAVWNGTAGEYSGIRLEVEAESSKEVAIFLLNQNIAFESDQAAQPTEYGDCAADEVLRLDWRDEVAEITVRHPHQARNARKTNRRGEPLRGSLAELQTRMQK